MSMENMKQNIELAEIMSKARLMVPKHLQGSVADCLGIILQAEQWGLNPYLLAQKTYSISGGTIAYESQLIIAVINSKTTLEYEFGGNWGEMDVSPDKTAWVRAKGKLKNDSIEIGEKVFPARQRTKNSSLWSTNPKQQASYLAAKFWARLYMPEVILGAYSQDELESQVVAEPIAELVLEDTAEYYPNDKFDENLPKWSAAIKQGKKSLDELIAIIESKAKLSDEQKEILKLQTVEAA